MCACVHVCVCACACVCMCACVCTRTAPPPSTESLKRIYNASARGSVTVGWLIAMHAAENTFQQHCPRAARLPPSVVFRNTYGRVMKQALEALRMGYLTCMDESYRSCSSSTTRAPLVLPPLFKSRHTH